MKKAQGVCGREASAQRRRVCVVSGALVRKETFSHLCWCFSLPPISPVNIQKRVKAAASCFPPAAAAAVAAGTAGEKEAAASLRMLNELRSADGRRNDFSSVEILAGECLRFSLPFGVQLHTAAKPVQRRLKKIYVYIIVIICFWVCFHWRR